MKSILILLIFMIVTPNCLPAKSLEFEWAKQISSWAYASIYDNVNDSKGNIYVSGLFQTNIFFDNSASFTESESEETYSYDIFIAKYNPDGLFEWAKQIKVSNLGLSFGICADEFDMIYLSGSFGGSVDFDSLNYKAITGTRPGFISKYSPDGTEQWVHIINVDETCKISDIHCDKIGSLYATGCFNKRTDFGNNKILYDSAASTSFIAKFDYDHVCRWAKSIKGNKYNSGTKIKTDSKDNIYIKGFSNADLDFGNNISTSYKGRQTNDSNSYDNEYFLAKYNEFGVCQWAEKIGDSVSHQNLAFSVDDNGDIYLFGNIWSSRLDFGNNTNVIDSKKNQQASYTAKLSTNGICQWAKQLIEPNIHFADSKFYKNNLYCVGTFYDSLSIENGRKIIHSSSYKDGFILNTDTIGTIKWGLNLSDKKTSASIGGISVFNQNCIYASGGFYKDLSIDNKFDLKHKGYSQASNTFVTKLSVGLQIYGKNLICENEESVLTATAGFKKYLWSTGETTRSIVVAESGEYSVKATDEDNTEFESESYNVRIMEMIVDGLYDISLRVEDLSETDQKTMKFENSGLDPMFIKSVALKSVNNSLELTTNVSLPTTLMPGEFFDITLTYSPETKDPESDSLIVIIDSPCPVRLARSVNASTAVCHSLSFVYPEFSYLEKLNMIDSRSTDSSVVLTWDKPKQAGAVWRNHRVPVKNGFYTKFRFRLSNGNNVDSEDGSLPGADGIAFVVQNSDPNAIGKSGGNIGYGGIENALAVELDLFSNDENQIKDYLDPDGNHIAVQSGGKGLISSVHSSEFNLGTSSDIPIIRSDGTVYTMIIDYNSVPNRMDVYLYETYISNFPLLSVSNLKLADLMDLDQGEGAYVGLTSATGSAVEIHEILDWDFCSSPSTYVGINDDNSISTHSSVRITPNPTNDFITMTLTPQKIDCRVNIYDLLGHKLLAEDIIIPAGQSIKHIDLSGFAAGAYFVKVNMGDVIVVENLMI
ncbi:MAG: T9SS type A sorting domain-containing protein, partial [Chlorobi bacterium]|nr:T9SS type A sorting domain-containing protein [Chlorobiota bacterium]